MRFHAERTVILTIPAKDTVVVSSAQELSVCVFPEGEGNISDKTYIVPFQKRDIAVVKNSREIIISNDSAEEISFACVPVDILKESSDARYLPLLDSLKKTDDAITVFSFEEDLFSDIRMYLELIGKEEGNGLPFSSWMVRQLEELLIRYVVRHVTVTGSIPPVESGSYLDSAVRMKMMIDTHYALPLSLTFFSRELNLTPQYLSKIFRGHYGTGFAEYLNKVRIEHAKELLEDGSDLITEIALDVGFNNTTHFCTVFKRLTGISPNAYRRKKRSLRH